MIGSGAEIKAFLTTEHVSVNGQRETRRGRQLRVGDVVAVGGREFRLIAAGSNDRA